MSCRPEAEEHFESLKARHRLEHDGKEKLSQFALSRNYGLRTLSVLSTFPALPYANSFCFRDGDCFLSSATVHATNWPRPDARCAHQYAGDDFADRGSPHLLAVGA